MVIELKASTRRSTYLAGESVKVEVKISNIIQNTARYRVVFQKCHILG